MKGPLPWVKWWTKLLHSPTWRTVPMEERGVYAHLVLLGGVSSRRGIIKGDDAEIAGLIGCAPELVTRAVNRFTAKPYCSLRRIREGVAIVSWSEYQAPANYDPEAAYGRLSADRKHTESTPNVEGEGEGEKRETKTLADLPRNVVWWDALAKEHPGVDLFAELRKAREWHKADKVKSPKLFFRNWVTRASASAPRVERDLTAEQVRERMRIA